MKFKTVSQEDLEAMSFDDIAYIILKEKNKKMKVTELFKIICDTLGMSDKQYEAQIGDFFALLATEKRFIQLEKGFWDLRENHTMEIRISDLEEEFEEDDEIPSVNNDLDNDDDDENEYYDEMADEEDDTGEDDLKDLVIVDENYDEEIEL